MNMPNTNNPTHALLKIVQEALFEDIPSSDSYSENISFSGDHDLNSGTDPIWAQFAQRDAAVLMLITEDINSPEVIFTTRAAHLRNHAGQISFPGGRIDKDETAKEAALREAYEEIKLEETRVTLLGYLDPYYTISRFRVLPLVGSIPSQELKSLRANPEEVADIFTVPLSHLLDSNNIKIHQREWQGIMRRYYAIPYKERYIWGATAGIITNLIKRMKI